MLRTALAVILVFSSTTLTSASIWESSGWALTGVFSGKTGYDSNLTLTHDGSGDGFVRADPSLTLRRKDSSSEFDLTSGVTATDYFDHREPFQTDYKFSTTYFYPKTEDNTPPVIQANASWAKITEANAWLGLYVEHERGAVDATGLVPLTGKLGIRTSGAFVRDDYPLRRLNNYQQGDLSAGLAYERASGTEISLNIGGALGSSTPNDAAAGGTIHSREGFVTARIEGRILPKVSGSAYAGYSAVSYHGAYHHRYDRPVGGADLTWSATTRTTWVLAAYSGSDFSPDGQEVHSTHGFLSFTHVIIDQWQVTVRGGPAYAVFSRTVRQSADLLWEFGSEIAYQPSDRFRVALGLTYDRQNADVLNNQFEREAVSLG
ncbi:MAG TPA: outer membrane beta-barrel protein, partial [Opitutaceae bacterium]|nr:outer membrane beta-barrel protein [Opitutaceae bacterium]